MAKLLLFLLVLGGLYLLIRASNRNRNRATDSPEKSSAPETMVRCAHCGVYLPEADALAQGEEKYCCDDHKRLGARH